MGSDAVRRRPRPGPINVAWEIFRKDLRIEMRTGEIVATAGVFSVMIGFLASMAFHVNDATNPSTAAGTIWITVFFAAVLSFGRVWQRERDESALTGLLVAPVPRASIFLGKALATFAMIVVIEVPLVALCMFLFHIDFSNTVPRGGLSPAEELVRASETASLHGSAFLGMLVLGTLSLSLVGTLFGAMTVRTRARDLVLAIVLFPLLSPVLICGVVGTRKAFEAQPFESYSGFVGLMGASAVITLLLGLGLFGALVDD
ncbi:ABC transporter involved in cytochrome c biogenesis, CcmB subunit [Labilithrix luteola]|uniref:Heme exporter protein B n=1 Tax=Labilithrix luteola TaxID=1391654 RepID=A0A0K1PSH1_9BACT|nr:heme exporter protein CcmB [Labilithrix luteola]AKU96074.1 ABC transporter involved in cytochrome c biogenesis, CcmB subunit [Labilithrix luteola]